MNSDSNYQNYNGIIESISSIRVDLDSIKAAVEAIKGRTVDVTPPAQSTSNVHTAHVSNDILEVSIEEEEHRTNDLSTISEDIIIENDPMCSLDLN